MMSEKYNEEIGEELKIMHIRNASTTFERKIWQFLFVAIVSTQLHARNLKISGETSCGGGGDRVVVVVVVIVVI
jgi:hypothetical protein